MGFCYETARTSVKTDNGPSNFDPTRCDAVKVYLDHYQNFLFLTFMSNSGTIAEKKQAQLEMEICQRKMKYWERQPHFIQEEAISLKARLHKRTKV